MIKTSTIFAAVLMSLGLAAMPALAQEAAGTEPIVKQHWSFAGPFGTFDQNQLQRGFQVFKEVCSGCHSARLLSFRNLSEPGGPHFSESQVKALAATYEIADPTADGGKRPGLASDRWPSPFATEQDARDANGGALPPDMSVLAKARSVEDGFPNWIFNYFTTYAEGGPDYIHALLNAYVDPPPAGFELPEGKHYNKVFPGHAIGMPPPLSDNQVTYGAAADGSTVPLTVDQYSRDVAAFLMWVAEPHLNENKAAGFRVLSFLLLFAVLMYFVKQRVWRKVEH
jgi:ubiquinol-cytochrome c reductase cytochrome c1 subunit